MSTSGQFGERQSWRRADRGDAGKRRMIKTVLTIVATVLIAWFLYIILRGRDDRHVIAIIVSSEYDTSVISPPQYGENARARLADALGSLSGSNRTGQPRSTVFYRETAAVVGSSFRELGKIDQNSDGIPDLDLNDSDDTLLAVLRGYLLLNAKGEPALACSDLAIGPTPERAQGLLPLTEILQPLVDSMPSKFSGTRLVVLDVEPLAAHASLGQWRDQVFTKLDEAVAGLKGNTVGNLWVLVTRGPMQNVGWDRASQMPLSTKILLDGLSGEADLGSGDSRIDLDELCAYMTDRYESLPDKKPSQTPRLLLLRGGSGIVQEEEVRRGDLSVWVARAKPKPDPQEEEEGSPEEAGEVADDLAEKISSRQRKQPGVTPVIFQAAESDTKESTPSSPTSDGGTAPVGDAEASLQPNENSAKESATREAAADSGAGATTAPSGEVTFWDLRDELESLLPARSGDQANISAVALAPHLWRQLIVRVLGNELEGLDPESPNDISLAVRDDLEVLLQAIQGESVSVSINDSSVKALFQVVQKQRDQRASLSEYGRTHVRLKTADALQHAVAVARSRLWAHLEFERQAAVCGAQVPSNTLLKPAQNAERVIATGRGNQVPDQGTLNRSLSRLEDAISLFDRNVDGAVNQLLKSFRRAEPSSAWELSRNAWAWLRSPLPTGAQRRKLMAALEALPITFEIDDEDDPIDPTKTEFATVTGGRSGSLGSGLVESYRRNLRSYEQIGFDGGAEDGPNAMKELLELPRDESADFAELFSASLRVDPRINVDPANPAPLIHGIRPPPRKRSPNVVILNQEGSKLDDAAIVRLETKQDVRRFELQINPDRDEQTRLLVSFNLRSAGEQFGDPPIDVVWKVPGAGEIRAGEPLSVSIDADEKRILPLEIRPAAIAESGEGLELEIQVRGDRESDQIDGVVGTYRLPVELPREDQLRIVASAHLDIGCSKEVISGESGLPSGLWLRTFNNRKTPFKLEVFNESGNACMAQVWLIRLENPMPGVSAYWPDFAANQYSNPEGGVLQADGRIQERFLQDEFILKGPATISIPAGRERVPLDFTPKQPAEGGPPRPAATDAQGGQGDNVSDGMAVVCRLVDETGKVMPEKDQLIYLVAKPWAPKDYITAKTVYDDGEVEIDLKLETQIDGDNIRDRLPEIDKRPVEIRWVQDEQWIDFVPETITPPDVRGADLNPQAGKSSNYFRVPVLRRRGQTWVRLDVDGWPRSIGQVLDHRQGSVGKPLFRNEIRFGSLTLTRAPILEKPQPSKTYFAPEQEVYFVGGGKKLIATIKADFADGVFNLDKKPEVKLEVEGKPSAVFRTDRRIRTEAVEIKSEGVITLLTTVSDLTIELDQGQRSNAKLPLTATLNVDNEEVDAASITAVLDSIAPPTQSISIEPKKFPPYYAPDSLAFNISASDMGTNRRPAAGIATIELGLDTKNDGKADTQKRTVTFDPPEINAVVPPGDSTFKFQVPLEYGVVARVIDASGNESSKRLPVTFQKKPEMAADDGNTKKNKPKFGWLHGRIETRAGLSGDLILSPAPRAVNRKDKYIGGTDRSFNFGPLPEGQYTLKFKGTKSGRTIEPLVWKGLDIDTTPTKSKPLSLDLSDAEAEEEDKGGAN